MPTPRVSLGLPVYNGQRYLAEALAGILAQTYHDFELIISDNASTDLTPSLCRAVEADQRVRYVRQPRNLGAAPNFNAALEMARGELFAWVAHDDTHAPTWLAGCVAALDANPDAVLAQSMVRIIDAAGRELRIVPPFVPGAQSASQRERFAATVRNPQCYEVFGLIRTAALRDSVKIGSYIGMDRALLLQLALRGRFIQVDRPLFANRLHPARASQLTRTGSRQQLAVVYDAANAGKVVMSEWRHYLGALGIIRRDARGLGTKAACAAHLLAQPFRSWDLFFLALEPLMLLAPGIVEHAIAIKRGAGVQRRTGRGAAQRGRTAL